MGTSASSSIKDRRPPSSQPHPHMYPRGVYRNMRSDVFLGEEAMAGGVGLIEVQPASLRAAAAAAAAAGLSSSDRMDREREYPLTARSTGSLCLSINSPGPGAGGYGTHYHHPSGLEGGSARGIGGGGGGGTAGSSPRVSNLLHHLGSPLSTPSAAAGGGPGHHLSPPTSSRVSLERSMVLPPLHNSNNYNSNYNNVISSTSSVCSNVTFDVENTSLVDSNKSMNSQEDTSSGARRGRSSSLLADIAEADETHHRREGLTSEGFGEGCLDSSRYPGSNVSSLPASTGTHPFPTSHFHPLLSSPFDSIEYSHTHPLSLYLSICLYTLSPSHPLPPILPFSWLLALGYPSHHLHRFS